MAQQGGAPRSLQAQFWLVGSWFHGLVSVRGLHPFTPHGYTGQKEHLMFLVLTLQGLRGHSASRSPLLLKSGFWPPGEAASLCWGCCVLCSCWNEQKDVSDQCLISDLRLQVPLNIVTFECSFPILSELPHQINLTTKLQTESQNGLG